MEFSNLGKHCYSCSQQDFLPFSCEQCGNNFCKNHITQHSCQEQNNNVATEKITIKKKKVYKCKFCNKKLNKYLLIKCKNCHFKFCTSHINHNCNIFLPKKVVNSKKCVIT